jgi:hypothetical protein
MVTAFFVRKKALFEDGQKKNTRQEVEDILIFASLHL